MDQFFIGIMLVIFAGACEGLFSLGVTRTPEWKRENIWGLGSLIALVWVPWPVGITLMGMASGKMGGFGKYAAFPMMLLCAVLSGNLSGALTGEWKGTGKTSKTVMVIGVFILFSAFVVLGVSAKLG